MRLWDSVLPHLPDGLKLVRYGNGGYGLGATRRPMAS